MCATGSPWLPHLARRETSPIRSKTLWRQGSSWKRSGGFSQPLLALQKGNKKCVLWKTKCENHVLTEVLKHSVPDFYMHQIKPNCHCRSAKSTCHCLIQVQFNLKLIEYLILTYKQLHFLMNLLLWVLHCAFSLPIRTWSWASTK